MPSPACTSAGQLSGTGRHTGTCAPVFSTAPGVNCDGAGRKSKGSRSKTKRRSSRRGNASCARRCPSSARPNRRRRFTGPTTDEGSRSWRKFYEYPRAATGIVADPGDPRPQQVRLSDLTRHYSVIPGSLTLWSVHLLRRIHSSTAPLSTSNAAMKPNALASNRRFPIDRR
jgi:hypothetical protein